ncbi:MAG: hypothetical protein JWR69_3727 [Pedosphaera sp.]|nr:hypothetical protein [Pedosphaera sp.]
MPSHNWTQVSQNERAALHTFHTKLPNNRTARPLAALFSRRRTCFHHLIEMKTCLNYLNKMFSNLTPLPEQAEGMRQL